MIGDRSPGQLASDLGEPLHHWSDRVVPNQVEEIGDNRYSPRYAWMFSYEKSLKYRLEAALGQPIGELERRLFGADGVVSEALSNAFVHGHRRDPERAITVEVRLGTAGLLLTIRDSGAGFDHRRVTAGYLAGRPSFHVAGNGLRALIDAPDVEACWSDGGRALHLLVT